MPTVAENQWMWSKQQFDWDKGGDGWSRVWGSPAAQWFGSLYPRLHNFLPARTILEIAPGYGRWTQFLATYCERLIGVDMQEHCIEHCRERFRDFHGASFFTNDGSSLAMVPDRSVDFVFSFDSLVHVEADCLEGYLRQLADKLTPDGVGFIHHSNLGQFRTAFRVFGAIPNLPRRALVKLHVIDYDHWRASSVSAAVFETLCDRAGLVCIGQEAVNWGSRRTIDCLSLFTRPGSVWERPNHVMINPDFMREGDRIRSLAKQYKPAQS